MPVAELGFTEGEDRILLSGMPATSYFMLVTDALADDPVNPIIGELYPKSVYADVTEADWSGSTPYARLSQVTPASADGIIEYTLDLVWGTGTATDGPQEAKTLMLVDALTTAKLIYGWDIAQLIGRPCVMNLAGVTLDLNPANSFFFFLQNVGGN